MYNFIVIYYCSNNGSIDLNFIEAQIGVDADPPLNTHVHMHVHS
jgi:hypothetical protein